MKRFLLGFLLFGISYIASSQKTWDGGAITSNWNDAANWLPDGVPVSTDNVVLDNSSVAGSYAVNLPPGAVTVTVNTLTITPSGVNTITLTLPSANTGNPGLSVSGPGDALVLNNHGILINSSGAAAGDGVSITNTFRINNGGHYTHNTNTGNVGIVSQLSTAVGTELGEFEFDSPGASDIPALNGANYGSLILSSVAAGGSKTYIGGGAAACNVRGNFNLNTGVTFSISMSANFIVQQNYIQATSSTFNLQSSTNNNTVQVAGSLTNDGIITQSSTGIPTLELNGSANQSVSGAGSIQNSVSFKMNNSFGATLNSPLSLPYNLTLTSGIITTTAANLLTLVDNATVTGGSTSSFVSGPITKLGDDAFTFPVGVGAIYAPISMITGTGETIGDEFRAEYKRTNPQSVYGASYLGGINHISFVEYWTLDRIVGTSSKTIVLDVHQTSFCSVPATTFVSRFNGAQWTNEPSAAFGFGPCLPYQCGTIISNFAINSFGPFTLATSDPISINPLPVKLISFDVIKRSSSSSLLNWALAECCSKNARFEIQKSSDGKTYATQFTVQGSETNRFYNLTDDQLGKGITYYRLKIIDENGTVKYSKVAVIINDSKGLVITAVLPNPVQENATLAVSSAKKETTRFEIYNISGIRVKSWTSIVNEGNNTIQASLSDLRAGVYHITASTPDTKAVFRFVKQ